MGRYEERFWSGGLTSAAPRRDRRGGAYRAYIPDILRQTRFQFDADVAADIADAERAITAFDAASQSLADTEALARLLLRAESVASSKIEGLAVGARRLLHADALRDTGGAPDELASEVVGNIDAMAHALEVVSVGGRIDEALLLETHRRLLVDTRIGDRHGGRFRTDQNWIGGSNYTPIGATFVPPPPELVPALMRDLCDFCNDDGLPVVAQAAIAHAQFETIHPFVDGNGRVGRALIQMIFRSRGLTTRTNIPVSLVLATHAQAYVDALNDTRSVEPSFQAWIATFASACTSATNQAAAFERTIGAIQDDWRERLRNLGVRSDSLAYRLIAALPGAPVLTMQSAHALLGGTLRGTMNGVERLLEAKIIVDTDDRRRRKRIFEARDIIDAFTLLERQLASPDGDMRISRPSRRVPTRPPK